jgi:polyhydroxyalkanoate synthesis regulator phasin
MLTPALTAETHKGGFMSLSDIIRNAMLAGFGVQEKLREFVDDLVKKGELSESQGAKLVKEWTEKADKNAQDISNSLNELVHKALEKMSLPSKDDIAKLKEQVSALSERIRKIEEAGGPKT